MKNVTFCFQGLPYAQLQGRQEEIQQELKITDRGDKGKKRARMKVSHSLSPKKHWEIGTYRKAKLQ